MIAPWNGDRTDPAIAVAVNDTARHLEWLGHGRPDSLGRKSAVPVSSIVVPQRRIAWRLVSHSEQFPAETLSFNLALERLRRRQAAGLSH